MHTVGVNIVIPMLIFDLILFYPITLFVGFGVNLTVSRPLSLSFIPRSLSLSPSLASVPDIPTRTHQLAKAGGGQC